MPLGDITYQDAALDAIVGSFPASGAVYPLFDGDPTNDGVELPSDGGYVAPAFDPAAWAPAADGEASTTNPVSLPASTGAYGAIATHWGIRDSAGVLVYWAELATELEVAEAQTAVSFTPSIFFDDIS